MPISFAPYNITCMATGNKIKTGEPCIFDGIKNYFSLQSDFAGKMLGEKPATLSNVEGRRLKFLRIRKINSRSLSLSKCRNN